MENKVSTMPNIENVSINMNIDAKFSLSEWSAAFALSTCSLLGVIAYGIKKWSERVS